MISEPALTCVDGFVARQENQKVQAACGLEDHFSFASAWIERPT